MKAQPVINESTPLLKVKGVGKIYGSTRVLGNIDFDLKPGEVHALVGENGAGKSTLLNILSGVVKPDDGSIHINDLPVHFNNPSDAQQGGVGTVFQELSLIPTLSIAENIFPNRAPLNRFNLIDWSKLEVKASELLKLLDLEHLNPNELVSRLPGSTAQLIEIAKAISLDNQILLLDEPTSALTPKEADALHSVITKLTDKGIAVVYISHHMHDVLNVSDRITVLRDGKKIKTFLTTETSASEIVYNMVGRVVDTATKSKSKVSRVQAIGVESLNKKGNLHDINLSVNQGEIVAITGLVGSGCHELGRCLAGADKFDSGKIFVKQQEVANHNIITAKQNRVAFLPEDRKTEGLFLDKSICENIIATVLQSHSQFGCLDHNKRDITAKNYIQSLNIKTDDEQKIVRKLSGGNQQKVLLAKWLETNPEVLIISEPTKGIDIGAKFEIHAVLQELASKGVAIIIISSDLPEVLNVCDRLLVMKDGSIAGELMTKGTTEEDILAMASGFESTSRNITNQD